MPSCRYWSHTSLSCCEAFSRFPFCFVLLVLTLFCCHCSLCKIELQNYRIPVFQFECEMFMSFMRSVSCILGNTLEHFYLSTTTPLKILAVPLVEVHSWCIRLNFDYCFHIIWYFYCIDISTFFVDFLQSFHRSLPNTTWILCDSLNRDCGTFYLTWLNHKPTITYSCKSKCIAEHDNMQPFLIF